MEINQETITDTGILSEISYSDYGDDDFLTKEKVISSTENGLFTLNASYTVVDYAPANLSNMQAIFLRKNDSEGKIGDILYHQRQLK